MTAGVEVEPTAVHLDGLAPGSSVVHPVAVRNHSAVPVVVRAEQVDEGDLFAGPAPLAVAYRWDGEVGLCGGAPVVEAGQELELTLVTSMPTEAGNEYQGATGSSTLTLLATEQVGCGTADVAGAEPPGGPHLALTGAQGGALLLASAVLVGAGVVLVRARRRRSAEKAAG